MSAIRIQNLSKCFPIFGSPRARLKQMLLPSLAKVLRLPQKRYYEEFWALKEVSFQVAQGETVGIIGRNGSGKSTLLQIICGTLDYTTGIVETKGRIGALLELGSSFNPEFTGLENIYLNAALLGLNNEETKMRLPDIVDFADIGRFIHQPVKTYSSGMLVRLAFAVQAQISPDILIVDEALAVGDAKFQSKCFERLKQLKKEGTSILLVTHSSEQIVTHCNKAVLLDNGSAIQIGHPRDVVNTYLDLLFGKKNGKHCEQHTGLEKTPVDLNNTQLTKGLNSEYDVFATRPCYNKYEYRWGDGSATILDYCMEADGQAITGGVTCGQTIKLAVSVLFNKLLVAPIFGVTIKNKEGVTVYGVNSESLAYSHFRQTGSGGQCVSIINSFVCRLAPGDYFISLGIATRQTDTANPHDRRYDCIHLRVLPESVFFGLADLDLQMEIMDVQK